jgi:hypothetical protein
LQYENNKYYLVGGEVVLSILKALGAIPNVLVGNITPKKQTLPEPLFELHKNYNLFTSESDKLIKEDLDFYQFHGAIFENEYNLNNVYEYDNNGNIYSFTTDNNLKYFVKTKHHENNVNEVKIYLLDKNNKPIMEKPELLGDPKIFNTISKIFYNNILPKYNNILLRPIDDIRNRLFRISLNKNLDKNNYEVYFKLDASGYNIFITKKQTLPEPLSEVLDTKNDKHKQILKKFIAFAIKELNIQKPPSGLTLSKDNTKARSRHTFGTFNPENDKIWLYIGNRNIADSLRTLAHELVHRKQAEDGRIDYTSGKTGSGIENEANAQAGILLRKFGKQNDEIYQ